MADLSERYEGPEEVLPEEEFAELMAGWRRARTSLDGIRMMISTLGVIAETAAMVHNPALGAAVRGLRLTFEERFASMDVTNLDTEDLAGRIQEILRLIEEVKS